MGSRVFIFDLDETVIDSRHRTPNNPDGSLNLKAYIESHTAENVAEDTLLPLARTMRALIANGEYVVILTARDMKQCDYEYLANNQLLPSVICSRDRASSEHYKLSDGSYKQRWLELLCLTGHDNLIMFDDATPVKSAIRALGHPVICGQKINRRLQQHDKNSGNKDNPSGY